MKHMTLLICTLVALLLVACSTTSPTTSPIATQTAAPSQPAATSDTTAPSGMPARPGSGVIGDKSGNLQDLVEVSGKVKSIDDTLVRITSANGSDFDLQFGDNVIWDEGVDKTIAIGNTLRCFVRPTPTFTTPNRGEVYEVMENKKG